MRRIASRDHLIEEVIFSEREGDDGRNSVGHEDTLSLLAEGLHKGLEIGTHCPYPRDQEEVSMAAAELKHQVEAKGQLHPVALAGLVSSDLLWK